MENFKHKDGKKIEIKRISRGKTMLQILQEQNKKIDELGKIEFGRDPDFPPNWYKNPDLYMQERSKRLNILNHENLSLEQIKTRLIEAEMVIAYETFTEHRLLQLYIEGRITIKMAIEHDSKTKSSRKDGLAKKNQYLSNLTKKVILEITANERPIHQNDFERFRIKFKKPTSTARKYWLTETGFSSTKKVRMT